jgi:carbon-monoxide dehydrogenase large subunit
MAAETASTACTHNPIGVKGCGECGTIASPSTVMNAVLDALKSYDIAHVDMPASPHRLWRAINAAQSAKA